MRSKTLLASLFTITLLAAGAARAEDDDPAKGNFTLEQATKGLSGSGPLNAKIETTLGTFNCELYEKQAPKTVANFVGLARGTRPWKDPKTGKNRIHLDVAPYQDEDHAAAILALTEAGAVCLDIGQGAQGGVPWTVLADPEGSEFCVLSPR